MSTVLVLSGPQAPPVAAGIAALYGVEPIPPDQLHRLCADQHPVSIANASDLRAAVYGPESEMARRRTWKRLLVFVLPAAPDPSPALEAEDWFFSAVFHGSELDYEALGTVAKALLRAGVRP